MSKEIPPLTRLVLFMICLAIAGSFIAGIHYGVVDLPEQKANEEYARCSGGCVSTNVMYYTTPYGTRNPTDEDCQKRCRDTYLRT